jgi:TPR repeat protein
MKKSRVTLAILFLSLVPVLSLFGQVTQAEQKAFEALRLQAEKGNAQAQLRLAEAYSTGSGVAPDMAKAAKWHRAAAEQGLAEAQLLVALDYAHGKTNSHEEVRWLRKAADQGLAQAQFYLGLCYKYAEGVDKNDPEAVRWFQKAADQNLASAQYELGKSYFEGHGVTKDNEDGLVWTKKAAEQGFVLAEERLARCYVTGEGIGKDYVQAYKWYNLAAAQGTDMEDDVRMSLAKVATSMTTEQIAEAQRLSHEFKPHSGTNEPTAQSGLSNASVAQVEVPKTSSNGITDVRTGTVNVKAEDDSLEVFADASFVGNPPTRLILAPGTHVLEVKKPGFKPYRKEISVTAGSELTLRPALEKQ